MENKISLQITVDTCGLDGPSMLYIAFKDTAIHLASLADMLDDYEQSLAMCGRVDGMLIAAAMVAQQYNVLRRR